ncbi:MAG: hypothetical protein ACR2FG_07985 [Marmoricola sp.]
MDVFRGRPLPMFQPEATSANDLLAVAWKHDLKYVTEDDGSWRAQEKGIDVVLTIGVIEAAMNGDFDTAVVFSNDTDQQRRSRSGFRTDYELTLHGVAVLPLPERPGRRCCCASS